MKYIKIVGACLLLASCSTVDIKSKPVEFAPVLVPDPAPMTLGQVQWKVYNANDIQELSKSLNDSNSKTFVLYGLDNTNFQNLDTNLQDMTRYILELNKTKDFYKNIQTQTPASSTEKK